MGKSFQRQIKNAKKIHAPFRLTWGGTLAQGVPDLMSNIIIRYLQKKVNRKNKKNEKRRRKTKKDKKKSFRSFKAMF